MRDFVKRLAREIPLVRKYRAPYAEIDGGQVNDRDSSIASGVQIVGLYDLKFTEPRVLAAARDLCMSGATVFDVGANFGGITKVMSRAVGPRGAVCAFEANPSIVGRCQAYINENGCGNTQIYHAAIYNRSRETIDLYLSENEVSDSIRHRVSDRAIKVPTLALDDFVEDTKLVPQFVKMDIEGAELDALEGFKRTISSAKPIFVLEQTISETRCLKFLKALGYVALDLSTYMGIEDMSELPAETVVTDILYAPPDKLENTPYRAGTTEVATLSAKDFTRNNLLVSSAPLSLERGRYIVRALFSGARDDKRELFCGVIEGTTPIMCHHGHSDTLSTLAHRWVFDAPGGDVSIFFQFIGHYSESFSISSVSIRRVDAFRGRSPLLTINAR